MDPAREWGILLVKYNTLNSILQQSCNCRDFLETNLIDFAKNNPGVVVYLKPRRHRGPVMVAEYRKEMYYLKN